MHLFIENESRNQLMFSAVPVVDSDTPAATNSAASIITTSAASKANAPSTSKANDKANMPSEKCLIKS